MARILPERFPPAAGPEPRPDVERRLYELLRDRLPDDYLVLYGVRWQHRIPHAGVAEGEADFVVAHPASSAVVIEVRGGAISYDATTGAWSARDRSGEARGIDDPVAQAQFNRLSLSRKLSERPGGESRVLAIGHAVCFPDTVTRRTRLRPDLPLTIVLDHDDIEARLRARVDEILRYYLGERPPLGPAGIEMLASLGGSFSMRLPLSAHVRDEDRRILQLTEEQFGVLDALAAHRRQVIRGCAGSGKTLLAAEKARRLASEGMRVLLTCFNQPLARHLTQLAAGSDVTPLSFHALCRAHAPPGLPDRDPDTYFHKLLPEALARWAESAPSSERFDAVVVDEAQDFEDPWLETLQACLAEPDTGIFQAFLDDNQNLYRRERAFFTRGGFNDYPLPVNLRNTRTIFHAWSRFYTGGKPVPRGPEGQPIEEHSYRTPDEVDGLVDRVVERLVREEGLAPEEIAILVPHNRERTRTGARAHVAGFPLVPAEGEGGIVCDSVYRFKGLEKAVVILAEWDPAEPPRAEVDQLLYVAYSRARSHLIVLRRQG